MSETSEIKICPKCSANLPPRFAMGRVICGRCGWTDKPKNSSVHDVIEEHKTQEAHSEKVADSVTQINFRVKRGTQEIEIPSVEALRHEVQEGIIKLTDYVYNLILDKWMYARELAELEDIVKSQEFSAQANQYNKTSWTLPVSACCCCSFFLQQELSC
jgi:ribosomal protein S27AE